MPAIELEVEMHVVKQFQYGYAKNKKGALFILNLYELKIGDKVNCQKDKKGFCRKVWVNGKLVTKDYFSELCKRKSV